MIMPDFDFMLLPEGDRQEADGLATLLHALLSHHPGKRASIKIRKSENRGHATNWKIGDTLRIDGVFLSR